MHDLLRYVDMRFLKSKQSDAGIIEELLATFHHEAPA